MLPTYFRKKPRSNGSSASAPTDDVCPVHQIGETAGEIYRFLDENGPRLVKDLVGVVSVSRDVAMQAIGWLARENKIKIEVIRHGRLVSIRDSTAS